MNTEKLTDALRTLNIEAYIWKFALYSTQKSRDGLELEWNLCEIQDISDQIELMREYLLKKPVADKPVAPYSPFLSDKENISALEKTNEMIREQLKDVFLNIRNGQTYPPDDYLSGSMPKITGYAFWGEHKEKDEPECLGEQCVPARRPDATNGSGIREADVLKSDSCSATSPVLFMRRGNPFLTGAKFYTGSTGTLTQSNTPILKLTTAVDFLFIGDVCYFLSSAIEKDFSFENRHFAIAQKCLDKIVEAEIIGNYESFERAVMTSKNARKFLDFDDELLDYIVGLPIVERTDFLEKYNVEIDRKGRIDTFETEQCEFLIDLLCSRSVIDPLGRLSIGSNITPRD